MPPYQAIESPPRSIATRARIPRSKPVSRRWTFWSSGTAPTSAGTAPFGCHGPEDSGGGLPRRRRLPVSRFGGSVARPTGPPVAVGTATGVPLGSFQRYPLQERALARSTADAYVDRAGRFLSRQAPDGDLTDLTAPDVTRAVLREVSTGSVGAAQYFIAALRAFLRFCFVESRVATDLAAAALSVTGRRRSSLPQGISRSQADALLRSCDRRRAMGRRDHAVLLTLLRLGLRATEVAQIRLDDIDWRAGEIVVHGKGRREDRLPLPAEVGAAIAGYLRRGRPPSTGREVFLRALAPIGPLGRGGVSTIACGTPASERGARRWGRTGCATRWPARWWAPGWAWLRSAKYCAIAVWSRPRRRPAWTWPLSGPWPGLGRAGSDDDPARAPHPGLPADAPRPGVQAHVRGPGLAPVRRLSRSDGRVDPHRRVGHGLGEPPPGGPADLVGAPPGDHPGVCPVSPHDRPGHGGPAAGDLADRRPPSHSLSVV